jgi:hypothetical protein
MVPLIHFHSNETGKLIAIGCKCFFISVNVKYSYYSCAHKCYSTCCIAGHISPGEYQYTVGCKIKRFRLYLLVSRNNPPDFFALVRVLIYWLGLT